VVKVSGGGTGKGLADYLKKSGQEIELQVLKLAPIFGVDLHELLSRTSRIMWDKWG
jgi:hypothetical protein